MTDASILEQLSFVDIEALSFKEFECLKNLENYWYFIEMLYHSSSLDKVLKIWLFHKNLLSLSEKCPHIDEIGILENFYKDFPQRFIYESNKSEWSKIPFDALQDIVAKKKVNYKNKNEIQEVENSIQTWKFIQEKFVFNKAHIKKVYHMLTKNLLQETGDRYPRWFRKIKVVVWNEGVCDWQNIDKRIDDLLLWYQKNKKTMFPLQLAFDFHLMFEKIHPFVNGNGRVGRMLMNKVLLAARFLPMIIFSGYREAYFHAIASTGEGRMKKYYTFMLEQYQKSLCEDREH